MKRQNAISCVVAAFLVSGSAGRCQTAAPSSPTMSITDSLHALQAQVQEMNSLLRAMSAEVTRSREEVKGLRQDLGETREELTSLRKRLAESAPAAAAPSQAATAQSPPGATRKSSEVVSKSLADLEEDQQLLSGKIDDQYQTKVESASKNRVRLSGIALLNVFSNRGSVDNQDLPSVAYKRGPLDTGGSFGATVRQSTLGLEVFGPKLANAKTSAEMQMDFFGGFPSTPDGSTMGLVRLRTAKARLEWDRTSVVAGQDALFFSPLSPTSLASLALPAFSYSGNLWTWTPQIRIEHRMDLTDVSSILIQGGILDPLTGEIPYQQFYRLPQAGERARQPAYATRLSLTHRVGGRAITLGAGGYYARQNWGLGRTVDAWAGTADWNLPLPGRFSFTGEFYRGRALGGLGGGTGRSVLLSGPLTDPATTALGLDTTGGWEQLKFKATEKLEFNGAFGEDVPSTSDLRRFAIGPAYADTSLARNQSGFVNFIYRARSNLLFSAEYRRLWTWEIDRDKFKADQLNLSFGVLF